MKKHLLFATIFLAILNNINAQILQEDFSGIASGLNLDGNNGWTQCASGVDHLKVKHTNLTYPSYQTVDDSNCVYIDNTLSSLGGYCKTFLPRTTGSIYLAFLYRDSTASPSTNTGDYLVTIGNSYLSNAARVLVKHQGGGISFGVRKETGTDVYAAGSYPTQTTHLLILKYKFIPGSTTNDSVSLYINPNLASNPNEPAVPTVAGVTTNNDFTLSIQNVFIRLNMSSTNLPAAYLDNFIVDTTWAGVIGSVPPVTCSASYTSSSTGLALTTVNTSTGGFLSFKFNYGDGSAPTSTLTHTYASAGTFPVCLRLYSDAGSTNLCDSVCHNVTITSPSTGIDAKEGNNYSAFLEYSPTRMLIVNLENNEALTIEVFDLQGKKIETVFNGQCIPGRQEFRLNNSLSSGIYFIRISTLKTVSVFKLIY